MAENDGGIYETKYTYWKRYKCEFWRPEYTNGKIIERVTENLELPNRYDEVFANKVSQQELQGVIKGINDIFNKMLNLSVLALKNTETEDEMRTLIDISRRYKGKKYSLVEVGLEDYFFVLRWFNNHYNDGKDFDKAVFDGLKWIFLDAIYNDGKIESIYESMNGFKKELNRFDTIFTVNYDTNLDQLSEKQVFHLHGSFMELDDTYRPETLIGELACIGDKKPTIVTGMEHIYCNAIMGFSGAYKMEQMMKYEEINKGIANYAKKVHEYPLNEFKEIEGELHIIGMSPCNDSHIINMINENANIVRVIFYCTSAEVFSEAKRVIKKPLQMRNVIKYWQSL